MSSSKKHKSFSDDEKSISRLGGDIIQWCILSRLDALSLARGIAVSKDWRSMASADLLWLPLCCNFFASRAQLPLDFLKRLEAQALLPLKAYQLAMDDACKKELLPKDMCSRTWEIGVKAICGAYWYDLDPTSRGEPALVRFFSCDGSITAAPGDPIWGGQESCWRFVLGVEGSNDQYVKINYWPMFTVLRLDDGRWRLENKWATYTTQPDLYCGTGLSISKEAAPPCSGCSYRRLKNALMPLCQPRESRLKIMLSATNATAAAALKETFWLLD